MNRGSSFFEPAGAQDFWVPTWAPRGRITPRSFANLENWWDADDASTITLDTGVSGWTDKAGSVNFGDPGATDRPVYATGVAALNNRAVIQFDGVNDNLISTGSEIDLTNAEETVFLVGKFPASGANKFVFSADVSNQWEFTLRRDSVEKGEWLRGDTVDGAGANRDWTPWTTDAYVILVLRRKLNDGTAAIGVWEGGGAPLKTTTHTVASVGTSTITLGMKSDDTGHYDCEIAELFRYTRKLPFAQIDSLCLNYLVPKFGAGAGEPSWIKMAA